MGNKRHKPEEIVTKLRQVDVLRGQGLTMADAIRQIGVTSLTYYRWRKTYGGMGTDQVGLPLITIPVSKLESGRRWPASELTGSSVGQNRCWRQDRFWCRWPVTKRRVWSQAIVMASPLFNEHLSLPQGCEDLQVQQLVAKLRVEALAVSVFPRAPRFDVKRLDADAAKPGAHVLGDKLGPIVGSNVLGRSVLGEKVSKAVEHIVRSQAPRNHNR